MAKSIKTATCFNQVWAFWRFLDLRENHFSNNVQKETACLLNLTSEKNYVIMVYYLLLPLLVLGAKAIKICDLFEANLRQNTDLELIFYNFPYLTFSVAVKIKLSTRVIYNKWNLSDWVTTHILGAVLFHYIVFF